MRYDVLLLNATTGWKLEAGGWRVCAHFRLCSAVDFDFAKLVRPMMLSSLTFATLLWTTVSVSAAFVPASAPSTTRLGVPFMRLMAVPVESRHQEANNGGRRGGVCRGARTNYHWSCRTRVPPDSRNPATREKSRRRKTIEKRIWTSQRPSWPTFYSFKTATHLFRLGDDHQCIVGRQPDIFHFAVVVLVDLPTTKIVTRGTDAHGFETIHVDGQLFAKR